MDTKRVPPIPRTCVGLFTHHVAFEFATNAALFAAQGTKGRRMGVELPHFP